VGHTDYLYKSVGFLDGAATSIDLFGEFTKYNISETPEAADAKAFFHDTQALKDDAQVAIQQVDARIKDFEKR
jgi:hypothetical protein